MKNVGFISSSIAHVVILGVGLVSLPAPETHDVTELEILPIELVSISDVTDVRKGDSKGKLQDEVKEATKKAPKPKEPEPKPEPKPKPVPKKEPPKPKEPAPQKKAEPTPPKVEPKPEPKVEPKPEPEPEAKVEEPKPVVPKAIAALPKLKPKPPKKKVAKKATPKRSFDSNALKALANKAEQASPTVAGTDDQQASLGSRTGKQAAAMTQSELDALRAQVAQCWSPPAGAADASQLRVRIEFGLDRQGNLTSGPEPIEFPANQFGVAAMESAIRAVRRCAPYTLPADKYDAWSRVRITFDPQEMF